MKKFKIWAIAGVMALFMAFSSANTVAVAEETNVVIGDEEWEKKSGSEPINLNNVTAKELIVESGSDSVLRINGGSIDTLSVVAPKIEKLGYEEIVKLLELGMDATEVADMYRNSLKEQAEANATMPTVSFVGDASVEEVVVSAGAVLNLAGGDVKEVVIKSDENPEMLTITIQNYDGKITVDQKKNSDGYGDLLTIKLKNSNPAEFNVLGEEKCSVFVEGDKVSELATVNVKGSSSLTLSANAKDVVVAEGAEKANVRIYSAVENVVVTADDSKVYLALSGKVENAKVEGDNVTFNYTGNVANKEITGTGSKIQFTVQITPEPTPRPTATPKPVEPEGTLVGNKDCSTPWWSAFSNSYNVKEGESQKITFWNYTSGKENYHNFLVILKDDAKAKEYAVLRADNWGWMNANAENVLADSQKQSNWNWDTYKTDMNGAKVEMTVINKGDTAEVKATITTKAGKSYYQNYVNIPISNGALDFCLTVEGGYLLVEEPKTDAPEVDTPETPAEPDIPAGTIIGLEDCTTPAWTAYSKEVVVPNGTSKTITFKNYTSGKENYHNFLVMLKDLAGGEYAVVRADNWGWGKGFDGIVTPESIWNWDTFRTDMNGATVEVTIANNGTTTDILVNITTADGKSYYQNYRGIVISNGDLKYCLTVEGGYLVIE
ncbi:MAG: hypothetical protein J6C07_11110 [Lachnospiraceae bacterium]|nr:hypothetical protein [Lachnospiraceae bacterium]